jgi:hypothetical protein
MNPPRPTPISNAGAFGGLDVLASDPLDASGREDAAADLSAADTPEAYPVPSRANAVARSERLRPGRPR